MLACNLSSITKLYILYTTRDTRFTCPITIYVTTIVVSQFLLMIPLLLRLLIYYFLCDGDQWFSQTFEERND